LFEYERVAAVVVALEIVGRGFAAKIAVNALVINVILARHVVGILVCNVSHKIWNSNIGGGGRGWQARFGFSFFF
jgi:hypothetical protein